MNDVIEVDEMHKALENIRYLTEKGIETDDLHRCKQILSMICFTASEFVVK